MSPIALKRALRFAAPCALIACSMPSLAKAQEVAKTTTPGPVAPLSYDAAVTGLFAKPFEGAHALSDWGYGLMLSLGVRWQDLPISAGIDLQGIRWGSASSLVAVKLGDHWQTLEKSRLDQCILLDTWLRIEPPRFRVRPYVEGFVGLKMLNTNYSLAFTNGDGTTAAVTDQSTASNYGFGFGLDVLLARASDDSGSGLFATLGVRQIYGGHAAFTRAPDSSSVDQTISFDVPTRSTLFLLGFSVHVQHRRPASSPAAP